MPVSPKAVNTYYTALATYQEQGVKHEGAISLAFANLLDQTKPTGWTLVPQQSLPNGRVPDGTIYDVFRLPRGYWEAKDSDDDLEAEIRKKIVAGYPLTNTIFEDSRRGVLYQDGKRVFEADLTQRAQLTQFLTAFFAHTPEQIEEFHRAVQEFKDQIPNLARNLIELIEKERSANRPFITAFEDFHDLCRTALDPNLDASAVEEMLVQHLLTERLFRTVFDNPDFIQRNVIASQIEVVVQALTSRSFSRQDFLRSLDYFYRAIEEAARTIQTYAEKQTFLNTVYERFFQGFSRDDADTHGIVYTPQPIVDFMWESVQELLPQELGRSLSDPGVKILDPCVGTGNFVVNLLRRLSRRNLKQKYAEELFCNENMLLPYYIASLNIEHTYYELTGEYAAFDGICLADTLDLGDVQQLSWLTPRNTERVERQRASDITVIIGNPPYNMAQKSENDNNKNRRYKGIDARIRRTYQQSSRATLKTKLYDPYVRFFRWATERLGDQDGIVCFVSNNSFLDEIAFDGMRQYLLQDFTKVYHLNLQGNVRKHPKLSGTAYNVFGIQVGVGITIAIRSRAHTTPTLAYAEVPPDLPRAEKLRYLQNRKSVSGIQWENLVPDASHTWLTEGLRPEFATFAPLVSRSGSKESHKAPSTIFRAVSPGVNTARDDIAYSFSQASVLLRTKTFLDSFSAEVSRWIRAGSPKSEAEIDKFVDTSKIKWSRDLKRRLKMGKAVDHDPGLVRQSLYRPFTKSWLYYSEPVVDVPGGARDFIASERSDDRNLLMVFSDRGHRAGFGILATDILPDLHLAATSDLFQCIPLYTYSRERDEWSDNISDWGLSKFRSQYDASVEAVDIFNYVYALLHHKEYRATYAKNLRRELPRIPLIATREAFEELRDAGARLVRLHVDYETGERHPLIWVENKSVPFSVAVRRMRLSPDRTAVIVNESLTLDGVPSEVFEYRLGNRSALEWVIDQYRVETDAMGRIVNDPNRPDDPEYIVELVERVVALSLETVRIVAGLPPLDILGVEAGGAAAPRN